MKWRKIDDRIWGFCDKRHEELRMLEGKRVASYNEAKTLGIPFWFPVQMKKSCAYYHAKFNDKWFNDAERKEVVDVFWKEESLFSDILKN